MLVDPISLGDLRRAIPERLFKKDELRFLISVGYSLSFSLALVYLALYYIPLTIWAIPLWIVYAIVAGTVWTGICIKLKNISGVLGHECGHGSFSNHKLLNDTLGYILHTALLVPYFSWQHSHAIHHSKTNHLTEGESHVPYTNVEPKGMKAQKLRESIGFKIIIILGVESFAVLTLFEIAFLGWPAYLIFGITGGPARAPSSHFIVPNKLFPQHLSFKVHVSSLGICGVFYLLYRWAQLTSFAQVLAVYTGPYLIVNAWLTLITYLQHTDQEVPHYDSTAWTWMKGALCTVDRAYPPFIDALHHHIGTTHVLHHIFFDLPHYNAKEAQFYLKEKLGPLHREDTKSLFSALWRTASLGPIEHDGQGVWKFK